jgi:DNA-binding NarL/FixJ family response regulator
MRRPRGLLADDHQMLLDAVKEFLEPSYDVVGLVTNGRALLKVAEALLPEIIALDISMPQLNGLDDPTAHSHAISAAIGPTRRCWTVPGRPPRSRR